MPISISVRDWPPSTFLPEQANWGKLAAAIWLWLRVRLWRMIDVSTRLSSQMIQCVVPRKRRSRALKKDRLQKDTVDKVIRCCSNSIGQGSVPT